MVESKVGNSNFCFPYKKLHCTLLIMVFGCFCFLVGCPCIGCHRNFAFTTNGNEGKDMEKFSTKDKVN